MAPRPLTPLRAGRSGKISTFQLKLETIVEVHGLSWIARKTGLPLTTIADWRKGTCPRLDHVQALARGLEVSVCYFADDEKPVREYTETDEGHGQVREDEARFLVAEKASAYRKGKSGRRERK